MQAAAAGTASGSAAGGAAGKAQTLLSCHGFTPSLRSCLAHNLYYNVPGRYFAAVGMGEPGNEAFYDPQEEYSLDWVNVTALPKSTHISPNETLELPGLNVFWRWTNNGAGYSFGHALVHELFPMFITIDNLMMGHVPASFNLVTPDGAVPQALLHIAPAFQDRCGEGGDAQCGVTEGTTFYVQLQCVIVQLSTLYRKQLMADQLLGCCVLNVMPAAGCLLSLPVLLLPPRRYHFALQRQGACLEHVVCTHRAIPVTPSPFLISATCIRTTGC